MNEKESSSYWEEADSSSLPFRTEMCLWTGDCTGKGRVANWSCIPTDSWLVCTGPVSIDVGGLNDLHVFRHTRGNGGKILSHIV